MKKKTFTEKVHKVVKGIPKGKTMTYTQVAKRAGSPKAFRAVGSILKKNFDLTIPCHRVIRSNGSVGDYNRGGSEVKERILMSESRKSVKIVSKYEKERNKK